MLRNLKAIRAHLGITQGELARRAALQQSRLCYLERGAQPTDESVVYRLADALGVPPSAFRSDIVLRADQRVELANFSPVVDARVVQPTPVGASA